MSLRIRAFAKTNLYLAITARRPDGYHDIETIFQSVSLADELSIEKDDDFVLFIETAEGLPPLAPTNENLIIKAAMALNKITNDSIPGARFHLVKRIPYGAGMGGGSADAAAAIAGINQLYSLNLSEETLTRAAVMVGMDVPFFLRGGTALGRGRGEVLTSLPCRLEPWLLMAFPDFSISTRQAYEQWQSRKESLKNRPPAARMSQALADGDWREFCGGIHNNFEMLLARDYPQIAAMKTALLDAGCGAAWLSGSGSAVIGAARGQTEIQEAARRLEGRFARLEVMRFQPSGLERIESEDQ